MKLRIGIPKGKSAGGDAATVRARRTACLHQRTLVLRHHGRSRNRMHVDSRTGDGPIRGTRRD